MAISPEDLAALLQATGHHHHQSFRESDGIDPEWALWYAGFLQARAWDQFEKLPTRSALVHAFVDAEKAHAGSTEPWPEFYARHLLALL